MTNQQPNQFAGSRNMVETRMTAEEYATKIGQMLFASCGDEECSCCPEEYFPYREDEVASIIQAAQRQAVEEYKASISELIMDLHICARRYCHGRSTYAPARFNYFTARLISEGFELNKCDKTFFAEDGMLGVEQRYKDIDAKYFGTPPEVSYE